MRGRCTSAFPQISWHLNALECAFPLEPNILGKKCRSNLAHLLGQFKRDQVDSSDVKKSVGSLMYAYKEVLRAKHAPGGMTADMPPSLPLTRRSKADVLPRDLADAVVVGGSGRGWVGWSEGPCLWSATEHYIASIVESGFADEDVARLGFDFFVVLRPDRPSSPFEDFGRPFSRPRLPLHRPARLPKFDYFDNAVDACVELLTQFQQNLLLRFSNIPCGAATNSEFRLDDSVVYHFNSASAFGS
ncbi:hypothetical protein C8F04DRAFT_1183961 [Mycena alexandri]|uniref:Uncharacterized protein n=1 Tax=Mycena alexandri TaxID=1745969 RepID=A0AAD6SU90_9AGAR|nr:hypothetical protein C8F04DRAFT_1183961 [Mycena alexandri]